MLKFLTLHRRQVFLSLLGMAYSVRGFQDAFIWLKTSSK